MEKIKDDKELTATLLNMDRAKMDELNRAFGLTDKPEIKSGMIVLYQNEWYRVRKCTRYKVNLGSIFGRNICHKGVPKDEVKEDEEAWYANWQQSDSYKCM